MFNVTCICRTYNIKRPHTGIVLALFLFKHSYCRHSPPYTYIHYAVSIINLSWLSLTININWRVVVTTQTQWGSTRQTMAYACVYCRNGEIHQVLYDIMGNMHTRRIVIEFTALCYGNFLSCFVLIENPHGRRFIYYKISCFGKKK